jgi:hypothetical protein
MILLGYGAIEIQRRTEGDGWILCLDDKMNMLNISF